MPIAFGTVAYRSEGKVLEGLSVINTSPQAQSAGNLYNEHYSTSVWSDYGWIRGLSRVVAHKHEPGP